MARRSTARWLDFPKWGQGCGRASTGDSWDSFKLTLFVKKKENIEQSIDQQKTYFKRMEEHIWFFRRGLQLNTTNSELIQIVEEYCKESWAEIFFFTYMAIKLMGSITSCAPLMIFLHFDVKLERESSMNEGIKYTNIYFMSLLNVDFILENNGMA